MLTHPSKQPRKNYRGRSFKKQDLTGKDFSYADIRGVNFTGANLTGAKFNYALAGLTKSQMIIIFIVTAILSIIAGIAATIAVDIPIDFLFDGEKLEGTIIIQNLAIFLFLEAVNIGLLVITIRQGVQKAIGYLFPVIPLMMLIIPTLAVLGMEPKKFKAWYSFFVKYLSFLGIPETPPQQVVDFFSGLRAFRLGIVVDKVADSSTANLEIFVNIILSFVVSVASIFVLIFTMALAVVLAETIADKLLGNIAVAGAGIVAGIAIGILTENEVDDFASIPIPIVVILTALAIAVSLILILIAQHLAKKILAEDENNLFILRLAVAIGTIKGTNFKGANLTDADFSHAILKSTNFRFANATRTFWRQTKYLKLARVEGTILVDIKVRDLLVTGWGKDQEYIGASLRGANLMVAELSKANLKLADLGEASLQAANLNNANLTEIFAIGTNFTTAQMSGTCLEGWNIDHTTILDNVESKYIYLLEEPKPETDDRERRPSSDYFQEGDFTRLFQKVLKTVDLIFRDGVDPEAFMSSFQQVQVENEGIPMKIQGMENKGDGVVLIRIDVPPETKKEKIHREFMQFYEQNVKFLEEKYQKELAEIKLQINQNLQDSDRKYQIELAQIKKQNSRSEEQNKYMMILVDQIFQKSTAVNYLVTLNFEGGNFATGFPVIRANIWSDNHPLPISLSSKLPPNLEISQLYQQWSQKYQQLQDKYVYRNSQNKYVYRIKVSKNQTTNISEKDMDKEAQEIIIQIRGLEKEWRIILNNWLNTSDFNRIEKQLRTIFNPSDKVRLIIQSENVLMQRIPWHLWNFFSEYQFAETAIGLPEANRIEKLNIAREKIRILAIFGDDTGLNTETDKKYLESLPKEVAETVPLVKPDRQKLHQELWDEKGWDIICFSGHSESEADVSTGCFYLGNETKMTIEELENALTAAISRGLQLFIFNSCDGLGLARQLAKLYIPAIIVMRQEVPDLVAQEFLKHFIQLFASGKSLSIAVRQAREKLESLEDKFPGASWLPVICQNSAEIPPTWQSLYGIYQPSFAEALAELRSAIEVEIWLSSADKIEALQQVDILTKIGEFSTGKTQDYVKSAMRILGGIVAEYPAANLMDEALNKLSIYFSNQGNHE